MYEGTTWLPLIYALTLSLKQLLVHMNGCRIKSLRSAALARKEARQAAVKLGPVMCPDTSQLFSSWLDAEGGTASRATAGTNSLAPVVSPTQLPPDGFPLIPTVWPGRKQGSGSTCYSPGTAAHATCKLRATQPSLPPPPHTSPFLKYCLSSVSFTSHFPYHT